MKVSVSDSGFDARLLAIADELAAHDIRRIDRRQRAKDFVLLFADRTGRERGWRLHRHEAENLEEMCHHHVAIGAGLLVESDAIADVERLRHVDLNVIDEVAVPDRLEQAVGETEGEDVLRRLLAEEMIDAENLLFGKYFMQSIVERNRALEIGAERLFHDDARALGEIGLTKHFDRRQRGARRYAHVVDALAFALEGLLRFFDRRFKSFGAGLQRHVVNRFRKGRPCVFVGLTVGAFKNRFLGERAKSFRVERAVRHADDPVFRQKAQDGEMEEARQELLVGKIAGRAKQHHDLRQLRADPGRHFRHGALHPRSWPSEFPHYARQSCDRTCPAARFTISPPLPEARPAFELDPLGRMKPLVRQNAKHARNISKKEPGDDRLAVRDHHRRERGASRLGGPDPLDFSRRLGDALEAAASDRFVPEPGDHKPTDCSRLDGPSARPSTAAAA